MFFARLCVCVCVCVCLCVCVCVNEVESPMERRDEKTDMREKDETRVAID